MEVYARRLLATEPEGSGVFGLGRSAGVVGNFSVYPIGRGDVVVSTRP